MHVHYTQEIRPCKYCTLKQKSTEKLKCRENTFSAILPLTCASRSGGVGSALLLLPLVLSLYGITTLILTETLLNTVKEPVNGDAVDVPLLRKLVLLT